MAIKKEIVNETKYTVEEIRNAGSLFGYNGDIVRGAFFNYEDKKEITEKEAEDIVRTYANKSIK